MTITQLSVFLDNTRGSLYEAAKILGENNIDIRALSLADTSSYGVLRIIVSDSDKAYTALKENGFTVSKNRVIGIAIDDSPGGLEKPLRILNDEGFAVEYTYAFIGKSNVKNNRKRIANNSAAMPVCNSSKSFISLL